MKPVLAVLALPLVLVAGAGLLAFDSELPTLVCYVLGLAVLGLALWLFILADEHPLPPLSELPDQQTFRQAA